MKKLLVMFIGLILSINGHPQSCLPLGITFTTQSQIDSFPINYPNCTQIEGDLRIVSYTNDISNLNGLSNIVSIGGHCIISNTQHLENLTGLGSLKSIGGVFILQSNYALTSFIGLDSLIYIGGEFQMYSNNKIKNLSGLEGIKTINDYVWIRNNDSLTSLSGLDNISADSLNAFWVDNNPMLTSCAIKSLCDYLNIQYHHVDILINSTGCNSEAEVKDACAGLFIENFSNENEFFIFPNPASTSFNVRNDGILNEWELIIINISGKELFHQNNTNLKTPIDIMELPRGIYFVRISNQAIITYLKIIKR